MKRLSNLFQFLIGFLLGVALLVGGTAALAYVFLSKLSANPPKPLFSEENKEQTTTKPTVSPSASSQNKSLPPGAYKAKVTWSEGLSIRAQPNTEAERIGGIEYNAELIVLATSNDGQWQKIRLSGGTLEGWVKAGNVEKVE